MTDERFRPLEQTCEAAFPLRLDPIVPGDALVGRLRGELRREAHRLNRVRRSMTLLRWAASAAAAVAITTMFIAPPDERHDARMLANADAETLQDFAGATAQSTAALQRLIADDWLMIDADSPDAELDAMREALRRLGDVGA
ncbi:MAG: hypothetical protein JNG88_07450 [Phycisphaerales bacterium]|nr:hypothetical protein [Phycisphaerales bacterium]